MASLSAAAPALPRKYAWALGLIVGTAVTARAWLQFRTPLAPGINGAYYFVQARAVLERGLPGIPDLPLTFWVQAGLAWILQHLGGLDTDTAVVIAVKSADALLPPLAALPVAWMGWRWQRHSSRPSATAALAPAALVCLGAQALSMTGDFQKNSLALVWLAALAPAAHLFLSRPGFRSALFPLGLLALLGLTHVGVLGAALVFAALLVTASLVTAPKGLRRRIALLALVGAAIFVAAGGVIYRAYDPARVTRLVKAFVEPSSFLENQGRGDPRRGGGPPPPDSSDDARDAGHRPPGPGGPGFPGQGPSGGGPPGAFGRGGWLPGTTFLIVSAAGLVLAWRRRAQLSPADRSVLLAAALTAGLLGGPFFGLDRAQRLSLIAVVPGALTLSYLLAARANDIVRRSAGAIVFAGSLVSAAVYLPHGGRPTISEATYAELRALSPQVQPAGRTLIVARHGLEWWTAWALHTHIAQPQAVTVSDWSAFDRVLYLTEKVTDRSIGGPSRFNAGGPPLPGGSPPGHDPFANRIPSGATTLHDGPQLLLVRAANPPGADGATAPTPR